MKIEFYRHNIGDEEKESVSNVLDSLFLTTGPEVKKFETALAEYVGAAHAIGVSSCTAALHLSLLALGIGPGDEVITTPMTFVATTTAIMHTGATPVWVDVEASTGNINAELIEAAITEKTRAILPVHLYGQMCDMRRIREIANRYNLFIIEDAAHALESSRDGVRVGELADTACFSFYATKSITSGEGGGVTTHFPDIAETIKKLRTHGINKDAVDRYADTYEHWDMDLVGWKYNMDNIQAALLLPQLSKSGLYWTRRKELHERYQLLLASIPGIRFPVCLANSQHGYHLMTIWVNPEKRDNILVELGRREIGTAVNYRSINLLSKLMETFSKQRGSYPVSERIGDATITLPLYPKLQNAEVDYVVHSLKEILLNV